MFIQIKPFALLNIEHRVAAGDVDCLVLSSSVFCIFSGDLAGFPEDNGFGMFAFLDISAEFFGLVEGQPGILGIPQLPTGQIEQEEVDAPVGFAGACD